MSDNVQLSGLCDRFRGFYPVVIDAETAGFNAKTDALLEIAAITLKMDEQVSADAGHDAAFPCGAVRWSQLTAGSARV